MLLLHHIQVSQETDKVVWYSHLFRNFPQFVVIHTVKGFQVINEAEVDVFLESPCHPYDPTNVGNLIPGSSAFSKTILYIWKFSIHILLKLAQTHDDRVGDAIQPFHPLSFKLLQHCTHLTL